MEPPLTDIAQTIDPNVLQLVLVGACLALVAFFAAAETAITSLGTLRAKHILENERRAERQLSLWLAHPGRMLTTILIYSNVFTVLAAAISTDLASRWLQSRGVGLATGLVTLFVLVFGAITPKAYAKTHADKLAVPMMRAVYGIYMISYPLVWVFSELSSGIMRMLGGEKKEAPPITEEDLAYLVDVGGGAGALEETKKEMIAGVFEFDETKVREIMTPRPDVKWLSADASYDETLLVAIESGMSRFPVCDDAGVDHVIGILLVKDLLKVARTNGHDKFTPRSIMREPFFVPESKLIMDVFKDLKSTKNHIAIVIDEHGGTAGLVTMEDILEEIVGEIQDEYDAEEAEILELEPGIYDVAGSCNIDEFLEFFELDEGRLPQEREEDIDTIAGWITSLLGELPEVGKQVRIGPLNVEVSDVERQRVRRVRVSKVLDAGEAEPG